MDSRSAAFFIIPLLFAVPARVERPLPRRIPAIVPGIVLTWLRDANATSDSRRFDGALAVAKFVAEVMPIGQQRNEFRRSILIYEDIGAVLGYAMRDRSGA
ncbi:MAG: hypothetical protein JO088_15045, partial [Acidobacteria bacterium]|nr:hypothetical protein [Acidobacteriota bacterium]